jgi:CBS domain-containing protein
MFQDNVSKIMTRTVVKTAPSSNVRDAARLMYEKNIGSLVISDDGAILGILTERDILRFIDSGGDLDAVPVSDLMTKKVVTVSPDTSISKATEILIKNNFRRLPVVEDGKLAGIVTTSDMTYQLSYADVKEAVSKYMSGKVKTIAPWTLVAEAVKSMVKHNIGCVIVVDEDIRGIITERDILAMAAKNMDPRKMLAVDIMTANVNLAAPTTEVSHACQLLYNCGFRRLPVVDEEGNLVGIITGRDLIKAMKPNMEKKGD